MLFLLQTPSFIKIHCRLCTFFTLMIYCHLSQSLFFKVTRLFSLMTGSHTPQSPLTFICLFFLFSIGRTCQREGEKERTCKDISLHWLNKSPQADEKEKKETSQGFSSFSEICVNVDGLNKLRGLAFGAGLWISCEEPCGQSCFCDCADSRWIGLLYFLLRSLFSLTSSNTQLHSLSLDLLKSKGLFDSLPFFFFF